MQNIITKNTNFVNDGIVDNNLYAQQDLRILWILKETNDPKNQVTNLFDFLKNVGSYNKWKNTWLPVLYVSYGLTHPKLIDGEMDNFDLIKNQIFNEVKDPYFIFRKIAIININKRPGYNRISLKELKRKYYEFKDYIISQLKDIKPDVVICGNVYWVMWNELKDFYIESQESNYVTDYIVYNGKRLSEKIKVHYNSHRIFIETYHPNQRKISRNIYYQSIISEIKKWIKIHKLPSNHK